MNPPKPSAAPKRRKKAPSGPPPLRDSASEAIGHFLETLDGEPCSELYDMVLHQVEEPLFKAVLDYTQHNQSHAAAMLGLNRGTLRKNSASMACWRNQSRQSPKDPPAVARHPRPEPLPPSQPTAKAPTKGNDRP